MAGVDANILHRDAVAELAGERSFARGQAYVREGRVTELARKDASITGRVRGAELYAVRLWVGDSTLAYTCSCPQGQEKAFCKHAVAVSLAWIERVSGTEPPSGAAGPRSAPQPEGASLRALLEARPKPELVEWLIELAALDPSTRSLLETRARRGPS